MNTFEMVKFLKNDYKMHVVVHHADGVCLVREFYVDIDSNGKIEFIDKKSKAQTDDKVGLAFFEANWEIYKYPVGLEQ